MSLHPRGQKWILVAGSGSHKLPARIETTAEKLGAALAKAGFGLTTGGWPGVDHVVDSLRVAPLSSSPTLSGRSVESWRACSGCNNPSAISRSF